MSAPVRARARIQVRRGTYRGQPGWHILGKDARGASVRIFSTRKAEADRMAADIRAGKEARFDMTLERNAAQEACDICVEAKDLMLACFCTDEQRAAKDAPVREAMKVMQEIADGLRVTAAGLRVYGLTGKESTHDGITGVHPLHAANRLMQYAERISKSKE